MQTSTYNGTVSTTFLLSNMCLTPSHIEQGLFEKTHYVTKEGIHQWGPIKVQTSQLGT